MTQLPPDPAARPSDTMKVRGRLRAVWVALWLAAAAGCVLVGVYEDTLVPGSHAWWWLPLFLFLAAVVVVLGVRAVGRGLDADGNGVVVRRILRATTIPWRDLAAIDFKGVDSEALSNMYYTLVFLRQDGSRVTTDAPGGGIRPGEYLFELRERLLAMQSAALGYRQRREDQEGDLEDSWPTYPDAPADRPSDAVGTDDEAAPAAAARSRVKRWGGVVVSVAVALAFVFVPLPSSGWLLWNVGRVFHVDVMPLQVYWEDLQPGMCVREDPNGTDYLVVDCNAEHQEEVISRSTLAGSVQWPGDAAVEDMAGEKCKPAFATYVGLELDESRLDWGYVTPDEDSWTDGKATLICLVMDPDHDQITRALRGAHE